MAFAKLSSAGPGAGSLQVQLLLSIANVLLLCNSISMVHPIPHGAKEGRHLYRNRDRARDPLMVLFRHVTTTSTQQERHSRGGRNMRASCGGPGPWDAVILGFICGDLALWRWRWELDHGRKAVVRAALRKWLRRGGLRATSW